MIQFLEQLLLSNEAKIIYIALGNADSWECETRDWESHAQYRHKRSGATIKESDGELKVCVTHKFPIGWLETRILRRQFRRMIAVKFRVAFLGLE